MTEKGTITWLPIEDAPKDEDETPILVRTRHGESAIVYWSIEDEGWFYSIIDVGAFDSAVITHFAYINPPEDSDD